MNIPNVQATPYGSIPVSPVAEDVSSVWTYSLDMRRETGGPAFARLPDESKWAEPGTFTRAVFPTLPGHYPTGEVLMVLNGQEVRLVGARTGRDGVVEVTADEVRIMRKNPAYAAQMRGWLADE
jgi:hypothetical protein